MGNLCYIIDDVRGTSIAIGKNGRLYTNPSPATIRRLNTLTWEDNIRVNVMTFGDSTMFILSNY